MTRTPDYDKLATGYARHRRLYPGVLRDILTTGQISCDSTVCEIGCGTGNYIAAIQAVTGCTCIGVDPSEAMLGHAKQQIGNVQWQLGRAEELPVADASVDLAFSVDVIHHVADLPGYYDEACRILRPGAKICTVTDSEAIIRARPLSRYFPETLPVELNRYPPIDRLRALMQAAGFADVAENVVEHEVAPDLQPYRDKAFSALHLISDEAFECGIERLQRDLLAGSLRLISRYVLVWGTKPRAD